MRFQTFRLAQAVLVITLLMAGAPVLAQDRPADAPGGDPPASTSPGWVSQTGKKAVEIGAQPVRDIGFNRRDIPDILVKAQTDPYSLKGLKTCRQMAAEVTGLNAVLGPDYIVGNELKESRAGRLAAAGGRTVVNSIIPFRGLVREISGAAPAERRLDAAVQAGLARRGFIRGVHARQGCRNRF